MANSTSVSPAGLGAPATQLVRLDIGVVPLYRPVFDGDRLVGCTCGLPVEHPTHGRKGAKVGKHPRTANGKIVVVNDERKAAEVAADPASNLGAMMGTVVGDKRLWALDADTPEAVAFLKGLGLVQHTVSGRDGICGHSLVLVPLGKRPRFDGMKIDVKGPGGYVVWPPSLHQSGRHYRQVAPISTLAALPVLADEFLVDDCASSAPPPLRHPLGEKASVALLDGVTAGGSSDPSAVLMAALMGMLQAGWTDEEAWEDLINPSYPGGASLRARIESQSPQQVEKWWNHTLAKAKELIAASPRASSREEALAMIRAARSWCAVAVWPRRANARVMLLRFLDICELLHSVSAVGWSCRDAAEDCGLGGWTTARDNLHYLANRGVLRRVSRGVLDDRRSIDRHPATVPIHYDLAVPVFETEAERAAWMEGLRARNFAHYPPPPHCEAGMGEEPRPEGRIPLDELIEHDLFRHPSRTSRGLGKQKAFLLDLLDETEPQSAADLSVALGLKSASSVRAHLTLLEDVGLVVRHSSNWCRASIDRARLDELARQRGVLGRGERIKAIHDDQRVRQIEALEEGSIDGVAKSFVLLSLRPVPGVIVTWSEVVRRYRCYTTSAGERVGVVSDGTLVALIRELHPAVIVETEGAVLVRPVRFIGVDLVGAVLSARRSAVA